MEIRGVSPSVHELAQQAQCIRNLEIGSGELRSLSCDGGPVRQVAYFSTGVPNASRTGKNFFQGGSWSTALSRTNFCPSLGMRNIKGTRTGLDRPSTRFLPGPGEACGARPP